VATPERKSRNILPEGWVLGLLALLVLYWLMSRGVLGDFFQDWWEHDPQSP